MMYKIYIYMYWYLTAYQRQLISRECQVPTVCQGASIMYLSWSPDIREPQLSLTAIFSPKPSSLAVESNAANSLNKTGNKKRDLFLSIYLPLIYLLSVR